MKEKIYTIQINDALEKGGECPICIIESEMEENALEYYLGPCNDGTRCSYANQ